MSNLSWKPVSRENCGDSYIQQWRSMMAGHEIDSSEKKSILAIQRTFEHEEALSKLTNEMGTLRSKLMSSTKEALDREIWEINECSTKEIKTLTSRLIKFLEDIKSRLVKSNYFDEIIPSCRDQWDAIVDQWSCDVHDVLQLLRNRIVTALRSSESSLIESKKFTAVQVEKFLNDEVIKLNQLIIVNERMYSETERQLKLVFNNYLQKWLISYSYREIITKEDKESEEKEKEEDENEYQPDTQSVLSETVNILEKIIAGLGEPEPCFDQFSAFKTYLDHLQMCQQHVKLHLKEALLHLKTHLVEKEEFLDEEVSKVQLGELWAEIVTILKEQYDDFGNYSKQAAYAWNQFLRRIHCSEQTAANTISKTRTAKLVKMLSLEEKVNSTLDQLREGSSVSNLESAYHRVIRELENAELICLSCREDEEGVIRALISAYFSAYDIFCLQLKILNENSMNTDADVHCVEVDLDDATEITDLELIRMRYCVYSAQTWIQGMKETLSMLEAELLKFLKPLLENVVSVYKGEGEYWLMLQLEKLTRRKKRIRLNLFDIRAAELQMHEAAQKHFQHVVGGELNRIKEMIKKIKDDLILKDNAVVKYLDETKTDSLEDTPEKKIKHLKDHALLVDHEHTRAQIVRKGKFEIERVYKWLESACSVYIGSLKLFHEGGNYSVEECDQTLKKMSNLAKKLNREVEKTTKKMEHVLISTKESFKKKLGKIVYPNPSHEALLKAAERETEDRLNISFNRLKEMIKIETYKAIRNLNSLKESMANAKRANNFQNWHVAMNDVESLCNYFDLSKMYPILELSIVLGIVERESRPHPLVEVSTLSTRSLRRKSKRSGSEISRRKSASAKKSFRELSSTGVGKSRGKKSALALWQSSTSALFLQTNSLDENNYLSNTKTLIDEVHSRVKLILTDAYHKYHVPLERSEMQKALAVSTLKHYNLQCESVWTQFFDEYINILLSLCRDILEFIFLIKDRHIYESVTSAMKLKSDHKSALAKLNMTGLKEKIDNKLKPWHGYPLNKSLLQSLLREVVDHCKEQLNTRKSVNDTYKEELKTLLANDKSSVVDIMEDAKFFFLELYTNSAYQILLESIQNYVDSKEFGQSNINSAGLKLAIQNYCSNLWKEKMNSPNVHGGRSTQIQEKPDDIGFDFLAGYKFWSFLPHMKNILKALESLQGEFQLSILKQQSTSVSISVPRSTELSVHRSIEYSWGAGESMEGLDDEIVLPLWIKFKEEIEKHVQVGVRNESRIYLVGGGGFPNNCTIPDFEADAIKNLTQAKKDFDSVASDLTRWKNEWISNIKEVNRLYLINPILDPPPKKIASDPAEYLRTAALKKAQEDHP